MMTKIKASTQNLTKWNWLVYPVLLVLLQACDQYPRDTFNSLAEAKSNVLLVGYAGNTPFVIDNDSLPSGIEVAIVRAFAESIDVEVKWVHKNEQVLLEDLKNRNLHLVISGLTSKTPWKNEVGLSESYATYHSEKHVIAVPPGEHALLFALEEFLKKHEAEIEELISGYSE